VGCGEDNDCDDGNQAANHGKRVHPATRGHVL
jgi:hypothetical protein